MTPEQAEEIYWAAYHRDGISQHMANNPVDQVKLRHAAMQAVIDAVTKEIDTDWAKRILALQQFNSMKGGD